MIGSARRMGNRVDSRRRNDGGGDERKEDQYRHQPRSRFDVTTPISARPMIMNGISKTRPVTSSDRVTVSM